MFRWLFHKKRLRLSAVTVLVVVTVLSLLPPKNGVEIPTNDKVGHFLAYATLTLNFSLLLTRMKQLWWLVPAILMYGVLIEGIQGLIPGRQPSFLDVLANSGGIAIGVLLFWVVKSRVFEQKGS